MSNDCRNQEVKKQIIALLVVIITQRATLNIKGEKVGNILEYIVTETTS